MVQTILIVIACIVGLIVLLALINGKAMNIEKSITINKGTADVFDYVKYMKNHENFSVWVMADPNMQKSFRGTDGTQGAVYGWNSTNNSVGEGEQEIKILEPGKRIVYELRFKRPMQDVAAATLATNTTSNNQTTVTWSFNGNMKFPMNAIMPLMKNMLGKSLTQSLGNLKTLLES